MLPLIRIVLLTISALCIVSVQGQDNQGYLQIKNGDPKDDSRFVVTIRDSSGTIQDTTNYHYIYFKPFNPGKYEVRVYREERLEAVHPNVFIHPNFTTTIEAVYQELHVSFDSDLDSSEWGSDVKLSREPREYFSFGARYSSPELMQTQSKIAHSFGLGLDVSLCTPSRIGVGLLTGYKLQVTTFRNDSVGYLQRPFKHERYFYYSLKLGGCLNFVLVDSLRTTQRAYQSIAIQAGAEYYLPIFFRHVELDDRMRTATRWIHQFTDVRLVGRIIMFDRVVFSVRYRLFDFIRPPFTEMPKLTLGLGFGGLLSSN